jgi:hypothetical protein
MRGKMDEEKKDVKPEKPPEVEPDNDGYLFGRYQ